MNAKGRVVDGSGEEPSVLSRGGCRSSDGRLWCGLRMGRGLLDGRTKSRGVPCTSDQKGYQSSSQQHARRSDRFSPLAQL